MPPRQNEPILGALDVRYEPMTYYMPETDIYTAGNRFYENNTATRATLNEITFDSPVYVTKEEFVTEINSILNKIYKVISEHVKLDITEEEFMDLLKE